MSLSSILYHLCLLQIMVLSIMPMSQWSLPELSLIQSTWRWLDSTDASAHRKRFRGAMPFVRFLSLYPVKGDRTRDQDLSSEWIASLKKPRNHYKMKIPRAKVKLTIKCNKMKPDSNAITNDHFWGNDIWISPTFWTNKTIFRLKRQSLTYTRPTQTTIWRRHR
jgi:hypothetical protein